MKLALTNSENQNFINLVQLLDAELIIRDGEEHEFLCPNKQNFNFKKSNCLLLELSCKYYLNYLKFIN
jgi:hypothetical protein